MIAFECWSGAAGAELLDVAKRHDLPPVEVEAIAAQAQRQAREGAPQDCTVRPVHVRGAWMARLSAARREGGQP